MACGSPTIETLSDMPLMRRGWAGPGELCNREMSKATTVRAHWMIALVTGFACAMADPAVGQVVGRTLDAVDDSAISGALIVLSDEVGDELARTFADERGRFTVRPPVPGTYYLAAHALGYESLAGVRLVYGDGSQEINLQLRRDPVAIDPVGVTAERRRLRLEAVGFYDREHIGIGRFLMTEVIAERTTDKLSDALRMEPSVLVRPLGDGSNRWRVVFRGAFRSGEGACTPTLVLDGYKVGEGWLLDELVHPDEVLAVELYPRGHGVPPRWSGVEAGCGVILIWTKRDLR